MAVVQLDSVNVVQRSHYLPFFARLGAYDRAVLDELLNDRTSTFEQWGHQASVMPIEQFPVLRHRWERHVRWDPEIKRVERDHPGLLERVWSRANGSLTVLTSRVDANGVAPGGDTARGKWCSKRSSGRGTWQ
jgi:uncharacterized protein YcaQ